MSYQTSEEYSREIGYCCFCGDECNACSQSCGICAREQTGAILGWKPIPLILNIYYNGVGSEKKVLFTEMEFRIMIEENMEKFNRELNMDPLTCKITQLVRWAGAILE